MINSNVGALAGLRHAEKRHRLRSVVPRIYCLLFAVAILASSGCESSISDESYGNLKTSIGARTPAGATAFRKLLDQSGLQTYELTILSDRAKKLDAIVWIFDAESPPTPAVVDWFNRWLTEFPDRTLVVVGRDYSPAEHYWQFVVQQSSGQTRMRSLEKKAIAQAAHDAVIEPFDEPLLYGWFVADQNRKARFIDQYTGPWSRGVVPADAYGFIRTRYSPLDQQEKSTQDDLFDRVDELWAESTFGIPFQPGRPRPQAKSDSDKSSSESGTQDDAASSSSDAPSSEAKAEIEDLADFDVESERTDSAQPSEAESDGSSAEAPDSDRKDSDLELGYPDEFELETFDDEEPPLAESYSEMRSQLRMLRSEVLLGDADGSPIIFQLRSSDWQRGRIIVQTNGAYFLNSGLANRENRKIAQHLIETLTDGNERVGMLCSDSQPRIRGFNEAQQGLQGFEMLTVWPLNMLSIHAIAFGLITIIALFPIFGRPKRIQREQRRDFGEHISAMGFLLRQTGDREYAFFQLRNFFANVRKERLEDWLGNTQLADHVETTAGDENSDKKKANESTHSGM